MAKREANWKRKTGRTKPVQTAITPDLYKRLIEHSFKNNIFIADIMNDALEQYLKINSS